jgi:LEA14-like dessication related protein
MKRRLYILLLVFPLLFSGCFRYEDIKIVKVRDISYTEFKGNTLKIAITATVNNPNFFSVKIANANMVLRLDDRVLGNVTQIDKLELIGHKEKDYTVHLSIELQNLMSNMINIYRMFMNDQKNLNLSGTVEVKSFLYHKTYQVDRLTFQ